MTSHLRPYQRLVAWQECHKLCVLIYNITRSYPANEQRRLVDQMCRAASSAPMNIAEGSAKSSQKERFRFYEIAQGSLEELHYQCVLSHDLSYLNNDEFLSLNDAICRSSFLVHKLRSASRSS